MSLQFSCISTVGSNTKLQGYEVHCKIRPIGEEVCRNGKWKTSLKGKCLAQVTC